MVVTSYRDLPEPESTEHPQGAEARAASWLHLQLLPPGDGLGHVPAAMSSLEAIYGRDFFFTFSRFVQVSRYQEESAA